MYNNSNNRDDTLTYFSSKGHQLGAWAGYFESLSVILCRHFFLYGNILDFLNHFVREASSVGHWALPCRGYRRLKRAQWLSRYFWFFHLLPSPFGKSKRDSPSLFQQWGPLRWVPQAPAAPLLFQLSETSADIEKHLHLCPIAVQCSINFTR